MSDDQQRKRERQLVEQIISGDRRAEAELFEEFQLIDRIGLLIRRRINSAAQDQQDLANEIALAIIINLRKGMFDPAQGNIGQYIYGIVRNKIRDYFKAGAKQRERQPVELEEYHLASFEKPLEKDESKTEIMKAIKKLEPKYQTVLLMRYYEGISIDEMASLLSITPKQVYSRIYYAHDLLAKYLEKDS